MVRDTASTLPDSAISLVISNIYKSVLVTATLLLGCLRVWGEMGPEELVAQALRQNPELIFYTAEIDAAKGAVRTAGTIRNPELTTQSGYKNARDNSGGTSGDGGALSVSLTQTFEYPGRVALRKAIAMRDVDVAELHLQQFRQTLAARVRTLVYGISSIHRKSAAAQEVARRFKTLNDVLAQRPVAGVTPQLEARIIAGNTVTFRRQESEAALAEATMTAELNQLCGRPANSQLEGKAGNVYFAAPSLSSLLGAARVNAFQIRIRQVELAQQGIKVALSRNERFPAVAVGPFYSLENATDREQQVGVGISLPLPLWDRNTGNIASSRARQQQAQASLAVTEREIGKRVSQSAAILEAKRAEIANLETNDLAKFREATEMADLNYQGGAVPLATYVEIQKQYLELIDALVELQKDALQAAQELEILTGIRLYKGAQQP